MSAEIAALKKVQRARVQAALDAMDAERKTGGSSQLCDAIRRQPFWVNARSLIGFAPMAGELDIWPVMLEALASERLVGLPRFDRKAGTYEVALVRSVETDIVQGYYGIREPADHCARLPANTLDLIMVPGLAFDARGRRLGRGKGYYDRLLAGLRGFTCGLCFDEQLVDEVPTEPHDVQLDCVLTPSRCFRPGRAD